MAEAGPKSTKSPFLPERSLGPSPLQELEEGLCSVPLLLVVLNGFGLCPPPPKQIYFSSEPMIFHLPDFAARQKVFAMHFYCQHYVRQ